MIDPDQIRPIVTVGVLHYQHAARMRARTEVKVSLASVAETNANAMMRSSQVKFCLIEAVVAIEIRLDGEVINIEGEGWACRLMRSGRRSAAYDRSRKHNRDKRNKRRSSAAYHYIV